MAYEDITNEISPEQLSGTTEVSQEEPGRPEGDVKEYKRWLRRIRHARKMRKDWEREYQVETCEDFYLGKQQKGLPPGVKVVNHFLATVNVTIPGLLFENPKFLARPKPGKSGPQSYENAKIAEGVLQSIAEQDDNLQSAAKLGLLQNFWRIAVLKNIYDPRFIENEKAGQPIHQTDAAGNVIHNPLGAPQPMTDPQTGLPMVEPPEVMSDETYRWEWVDARNMLLPDDGPDMAKWTWIGEEIEVALEDAQEDDRFPQELRDKFRDAGKKEDKDPDQDYGNVNDTKLEEYEPCFRYVEVYDIKKQRWMIVTEQADIQEFLFEGPLPDGIEDHPYAILPGWIANTGPKPSPWPLPFTNPWLDLQREYNIRRQQMMEGAKRSARKILYDATTFEDSDEATKALQSNKDMEAVLCKDHVGRPPTMMQETPLNASITNDVPALLMDWRIITGQTGAKVGTPAADTATEATFVERASNLRDAELQKAVTRWLKIAGRKMWQLVRATLTLHMFVKIRGMDDKAVQLYLTSTFGIPPEALMMFPHLAQGLIDRFGQQTIEKVTREDLQFEADIDIVPSSTRPRNLTVERQQWLEFVGLLAQAPQLALSRSLLEETAAKFDFITPQMVEELHALAITMIQAQQATAGRQQGGANPETGKGTAEAKKNGNLSQASQGAELQ